MNILLYIIGWSAFLKFFEYVELFIPVIFLLFTHKIDERVHEALCDENAYHNTKVRWIFKFQWETYFLIISLLFIEGIKISLKNASLIPFGVSIIIMSLLMLMFILYKAANLFNFKRKRPTIFPAQGAIFIYSFYLCLDILFLKNEDFGHLFVFMSYKNLNEAYIICLLILLIASVTVVLLTRYLNNELFDPVISDSDIIHNIHVYRHRKTPIVKKREALKQILMIYANEKPRRQKQIEFWLKEGNKFPEHIHDFKIELNL